ncbi:MAG: Fic family protein [Candidatus Magnetomorum sp.]|nr:Fic family protein [Candidatus Magnetomorum sp.]
MVNTCYLLNKTPAIEHLLDEIDSTQAKIDAQKPYENTLWQTIQEKLKIEWTFDSNALEGSTLTKGDTYFFLQEGLTVEGKPLKDFLDARNHAEAVDYIYQIIKEKRPITTGLIKSFNSLLLSGITHTRAINHLGETINKPATPGKFKQLPNHVLQHDGSIHRYTEPIKVLDEMDFLCQWINENMHSEHAVIVASMAHYNMVRIHPFDDGNGRGARILMNLILMIKGYPPAVIRNEHRRHYLDALRNGDQGFFTPFIELVATCIIDTQKIIITDLNN